MPNKYLLYIDMLGFSDLVLRRGAVDELYALINSLNVHKHHAFKTSAFSDTLIVYNIYETDTPDSRRYHVMYMCEFAQDLFYRLVPRDLHFRAFLTKGEFEHQQLDNLQAFYGKALVAAYRREKTIDCTGLFIDAPILPDCTIFHYERYDAETYFIHLMQSLDQTRFKDVTGGGAATMFRSLPRRPRLSRSSIRSWGSGRARRRSRPSGLTRPTTPSPGLPSAPAMGNRERPAAFHRRTASLGAVHNGHERSEFGRMHASRRPNQR
jgi:hypothetical protein